MFYHNCLLKKRSEDLRVGKNPNCSGNSFLVYTRVSISCMGQNIEIKFTNLSGWIFLYFLENNLQVYVAYSKLVKCCMDNDLLNCYLLQ